MIFLHDTFQDEIFFWNGKEKNILMDIQKIHVFNFRKMETQWILKDEIGQCHL